MNCVKTLIYMLLAVVVSGPAVWAQALSVDWKFYGGVSLDKKRECFYDAKCPSKNILNLMNLL